jgi:hypothetical protein
MNLPDVLYIRDPPAESVSDTPSKSVDGAEGNNRQVILLWDAFTDPHLKHLDVRVLGVLRGCQWEKPYAEVGRRKLAEWASTSLKHLAQSIRRLKDRGWVKVLASGVRGRGRYQLQAVKFNPSKKRGRRNAIPAETLKAKKELVRCPLCSKLCKQILKVGWCRRCGSDKRVERISERVARRVVGERTA